MPERGERCRWVEERGLYKALQGYRVLQVGVKGVVQDKCVPEILCVRCEWRVVHREAQVPQIHDREHRSGTGVAFAGGAILVCLGFCPKLMAVITSLPTPVINGVFAMVCMTLISNGVKMVKDTVMDDRATMILGVSVMSGMSTMILPDSVIRMAPQFIQYFLSSGIAVGGTVAIVLQLLLPKTRGSEAVRVQGTDVAGDSGASSGVSENESQPVSGAGAGGGDDDGTDVGACVSAVGAIGAAAV